MSHFLRSMFYDLCLLIWIYLNWALGLGYCTLRSFGLLRLVVWSWLYWVYRRMNAMNDRHYSQDLDVLYLPR
jgi:hypothetical protein